MVLGFRVWGLGFRIFGLGTPNIRRLIALGPSEYVEYLPFL